jgi:hypothetical protein
MRETMVGAVVEARPFAARLRSRWVQLAARKTPLALGAERVEVEVRIAPPPGLHLEAAPPQRVESPFGTFTREERVEGGALLRTERLEVRRSRVPPERYAELVAFASAVDEIQERPVALTR